jgi:DNA-binding NarL/FixJ family response regulator
VDSSKKILNIYSLEEERRQQIKKRKDLKLELLTRTERCIFNYLAQGKTIKEIADLMYRSYHTIATHKKSIFRKLGFTKINDLVNFANEMKYNSEK